MSDWPAVADAVRARLAELDLTHAAAAQRAGVAPMTFRELVQGTDRRRSARTLAAVSEALGWAPGHLAAVARGEDTPATGDLAAELAELRREVRTLRARVDALERNH